MAYGDYGGNAWGHGGWRRDRCDAVVFENGIVSEPGTVTPLSVPGSSEGRRFHVLLGDGDVMVGLYKQSSVTILLKGEEVSPLSCVTERIEGDSWTEAEGPDDFNSDAWLEAERLAVFEVEGHRILVRWERKDNSIVYAQLEQPDGQIWMGWSGFEVGAGFESTAAERSARLDARMWEILDESSYKRRPSRRY